MAKMANTHGEINFADTHKDGLLDIFIGLCILLVGLFLLTELVYLAGVIPAIFLPLWQPVRKKTLMRLGLEDIPDSQKSKKRLMLLFSLFLGVLTFSAVLGLYLAVSFDALPPRWVGWIGENFIFALFVLGAAMMAFSAWLTGVRRLFFYSALLLLFVIAAEALGVSLALALIALGVVILMCGLWLYGSFLRRYPAV
jgi:hypothetical protein